MRRWILFPILGLCFLFFVFPLKAFGAGSSDSQSGSTNGSSVLSSQVQTTLSATHSDSDDSDDDDEIMISRPGKFDPQGRPRLWTQDIDTDDD